MTTGKGRENRGWSERPPGAPSLDDLPLEDRDTHDTDPREHTQPGLGIPAPAPLPEEASAELSGALLFQSERLRLVEQRQTHQWIEQLEHRLAQFATDTKDDIFGLREMLSRMDRVKDEQHKAERAEDKRDLTDKLDELRSDMKSRTLGRPLIWLIVVMVFVGAAGAAAGGWSLLSMQHDQHLRDR